jgi:Flp pilus assembly protein CpaB
MRHKHAIFIVLTCCGFVGAFLGGRLTANGGRKVTASREKEETIEVLVARKEIPVGVRIDETNFAEYVEAARFLKSSVPPDIVNQVDEIKGKKLNRTLKQGNYFAADDLSAVVDVRLPEGKFQFAIKLNEIFALPQSGDKVDAVLVASSPDGQTDERVILRNLLVLGLDTTAPRGGSTRRFYSAGVVVTSDEALILAAA